MNTISRFGSGLVGATLFFSIGIGIASAQAAPGLAVSLSTAPSVPAGSSQVALATVTLDATHSGQNVTFSSLPLSLSYNGVPPTAFTNCSVQDVVALGFPLTSGGNAVTAFTGSGVTFHLNAPFTIIAGTSVRFAIVCDVSPAAPAGSSITFSIAPAVLSATSASGTAVVPTSTGQTAGAVSVTAGTASSVTTPTTSATPGIPNTGFGGDALATLLIMSLSLLAAYIGATVSRRLQMKKGV